MIATPSRRRFMQAAVGALAASSPARSFDLGRLLAIPGPGRVRAVLDTDAGNGIDDQYAIAYSLASRRRLSIEAIYSAPFVNDRSPSAAAGLKKSHGEILRLLDFFPDASATTVLRGSSRFLAHRGRPVESAAAQNLIEKALGPREEPLYVLAIGCPVNVSSAILMEPRIRERIIVVWLGGTAHHWPVASEFNLQQDLIASQVLFDSGVPLVQIPAKDVSEQLRTTGSEQRQFLRGRSRVGDYLYARFLEYQAAGSARRGTEFPYSKVIWDLAAVAWLNNPAWVPSQIVPSPVLTDDMRWEAAAGRHSMRVASGCNRDLIFDDVFSRLASLQESADLTA